MLGIGLSLTSSPAARWTPAALGASLYDYWDAEQASTLTLSGAEVSEWRSVVNGYGAAQGTSANRPAYSATSFNGRPGVTFDGTNDELTYAGVGVLPVGGAGSEIWALVDQNVAPADTATRTPFCYGGNTSSTYRRVYRTVVTGVNRAGAQMGTGGGGPTSVNTSVDYSGRHVHRGVILTTGIRCDVDGTAGPVTASTPATGTVRTRIGATTDNTPSAYNKGVLNFVAVTALLDAEQAAQMYAFLNARR